MIHLIDQAVEQLLRVGVPLPASSIDVSFAAPDRAWGSSITRPTVNAFLWDVKRNVQHAQSGWVESTIDGKLSRRPTSPVVELRYYVTAWASQGRDEHQLLGGVLRCVLRNGVVPRELVPELLGDTDIILQLATADDRGRPSDFWSALDGQLKPGLELRLILDVDAFEFEEAAEPATIIEAQVIAPPAEPGAPPSQGFPPAPTNRRVPPTTRGRRGAAVVSEGIREQDPRPQG
jgi:hypothetical protein